MSDPVDVLVLDLLEWLAPRPKGYAAVMDAWRTSCPRLPVWEDAVDRHFVSQTHSSDRGSLVELTPLGREHLTKNRGAQAAK